MKDNNIMVFENEQFGAVRILEEGEKPLFCGADVARALGYGQPHKAIVRHCRYGMKRTVPHPQAQDKVLEMIFIPEGDVYRLICHSKMPYAERFESWVFDEVLPSIRRNGAYVTDTVLDQLDEHPELVSEFIANLRAENTRAKELRKQLAKAKEENACLTPKADYYDAFVGIDDLTCLRYTAKELGVPQNKFIGYMLEKGYVFRDRHRDGRVFAKAGERNDPLFKTRDFHLPHGRKSEYTLVTPAGKSHFKALVPEIEAFVPKKEADETVSKGERETESAVYLK